MRFQTFLRALVPLAHPVSLAALTLLFLNDHLLRRLWPSWWTGKLGDAAWLVFAPLAMAALLALVSPAQRANADRHARRLTLAAIALTAAVFILGKTAAPFHALLLAGAEALLGLRLTVRLDPSDLLALPFLLVSWRVALSGHSAAAPVTLSIPRLSRGLIALPLAALLTLANSAAPNVGVECLAATNGDLWAHTAYASYRSDDGGLTWQDSAGAAGDCFKTHNAFSSENAEWQTLAAQLSNVQFRYKPGEPIQLSRDQGATWQDGFTAVNLSSAEEAYLLKTQPGNPWYAPGPLDAVEDPEYGHVLFAMGHQGVLVYEPPGQWHWADVNGYAHRTPFPDLTSLWGLLNGELWLALGAGLLIFTGLALLWLRHWLRWVVFGLAALAWLGVVILFPPAITTLYLAMATAVGTLIMAVLFVPLAIENGVRLAQRTPRALPRLGGLALLAVLLFLLPYLLWAYNALPQYEWALGFALALIAAVAVAGVVTLRRVDAR